MYEFLQHLINGLAAGTIYALVALGYTMVYGVLKLINFAHGDVMMLGVYVGYAVAFLAGPRLHLGTIALARCWCSPSRSRRVRPSASSSSGSRTGRCATSRGSPSLITAIGISFALSYGFQLDLSVNVGGHEVTDVCPGAASRRFPAIIRADGVVRVLGDNDVIIWNWQVISPRHRSWSLMGGAAVPGVPHAVRQGDARGLATITASRGCSAFRSTPSSRCTFMLGSALAAGAGILYAIKDKSIQPLMGMYVGLKAFVAAVIGGIGNLPGAVVGALALGLCEEFVVGYTASSWRDAVAFGFLIVVLLVRPEGLFGRAQAEKV